MGDPFGEDWQQTPVRQGERQGEMDKKYKKILCREDVLLGGYFPPCGVPE